MAARPEGDPPDARLIDACGSAPCLRATGFCPGAARAGRTVVATTRPDAVRNALRPGLETAVGSVRMVLTSEANLTRRWSACAASRCWTAPRPGSPRRISPAEPARELATAPNERLAGHGPGLPSSFRSACSSRFWRAGPSDPGAAATMAVQAGALVLAVGAAYARRHSAAQSIRKHAPPSPGCPRFRSWCRCSTRTRHGRPSGPAARRGWIIRANCSTFCWWSRRTTPRPHRRSPRPFLPHWMRVV